MAKKLKSEEGKGQHGWRRLLAGLKQRFAGDVIAAEIGEDAQGVAVGKNIIQIGSLVIPTLPLLALIMMVAAAFVYLVFLPRGPKEMSGEFNVAVAQFGQLDTAGTIVAKDDSKNLSRWLFERLQAEYKSLMPEINTQIWHDSLDLGVRIGIIQGLNPETRAEAAADLAKRIKADLVVYGNLATEGEAARFIPEFYVAELDDAAEEIVGRHELGAPIQLQLPVDRLGTRLQFNHKLSARAKALTFFTLGLAWEFSDRPDRALDFFQQAAGVEDWADDEGKEVVYLFIGREAFILWRKGEDMESEALEAFQRALELNPDYVRANIGLGNFYYQKAEGTLGQPEANLLQMLDNVERAIVEYRQALESKMEIPGQPVEIRSHLALSGAYRLKGDIYLRLAEPERADEYFNLAVSEAEIALEMIDTDLPRDRVHAFLNLGAAYHLKAHNLLSQGNQEESTSVFHKALEAYSSCSQYAADQSYDFFSENLDTKYCTPYRQVVKEVLIDLEGENQ